MPCTCVRSAEPHTQLNVRCRRQSSRPAHLRKCPLRRRAGRRKCVPARERAPVHARARKVSPAHNALLCIHMTWIDRRTTPSVTSLPLTPRNAHAAFVHPEDGYACATSCTMSLALSPELPAPTGLSINSTATLGVSCPNPLQAQQQIVGVRAKCARTAACIACTYQSPSGGLGLLHPQAERRQRSVRVGTWRHKLQTRVCTHTHMRLVSRRHGCVRMFSDRRTLLSSSVRAVTQTW